MPKAQDAASLAKDVATGDKYGAEAAQIRHLLEQNNTAAAGDRLRLDAGLKPHELHALVKALQKECGNLPNVSINDNRNGIDVTVQADAGDGKKETHKLFERSAEELGQSNDKIPMTGELLGLTQDQTKNILAIQAKEKAENGGKSHLFGDIAVSLGYRTAEEVNAALRKQDRLNADQTANDLAHAMPLAPKEGYFQMLKRTHPELADDTASSLAHRMLRLNHGRINLHAGEQLAILNDKERGQLADSLYEKRAKTTGVVRAKAGQNLAEVPFS